MVDKDTDLMRWDDGDFWGMCWHDCLVHGFRLDQDGEFQSDLVIDLDYIVEWIKRDDGVLEFRVGPAVLRFRNVCKLRIGMSLDFKEPIVIDSIDRVENEDRGFKSYHWVIDIQSYSETTVNRIEFDAAGFVQEMSAAPVVIKGQSLSRVRRDEMRYG